MTYSPAIPVARPFRIAGTDSPAKLPIPQILPRLLELRTILGILNN
jgi:hypothetical protein